MVCVHTGSRWANANTVHLIIYVCETETMSWGGGALYVGVCLVGLGYLSLARKHRSTHAFKITVLVITETRLMLPQNSHIVVSKSLLPLGLFILGFLLLKGAVSSNLAQCKAGKVLRDAYGCFQRHIKY